VTCATWLVLKASCPDVRCVCQMYFPPLSIFCPWSASTQQLPGSLVLRGRTLTCECFRLLSARTPWVFVQVVVWSTLLGKPALEKGTVTYQNRRPSTSEGFYHFLPKHAPRNTLQGAFDDLDQKPSHASPAVLKQTYTMPTKLCSECWHVLLNSLASESHNEESVHRSKLLNKSIEPRRSKRVPP